MSLLIKEGLQLGWTEDNNGNIVVEDPMYAGLVEQEDCESYARTVREIRERMHKRAKREDELCEWQAARDERAMSAISEFESLLARKQQLPLEVCRALALVLEDTDNWAYNDGVSIAEYYSELEEEYIN